MVSGLALIGFTCLAVMIFVQQTTIRRQMTGLAMAALSDLAAETQSNGEADAAVNSYERLIRLQESNFGSDDPKVLKTRERLAYTLASTDDFEESIVVWREPL